MYDFRRNTFGAIDSTTHIVFLQKDSDDFVHKRCLLLYKLKMTCTGSNISIKQ